MGANVDAASGRTVKVLATGFEAFDGRSINSSWSCLAPLADAHLPGVRLTVLELPVSRQHAGARLLDALAASDADALVMFGEAGERDRVTPERVAINIDDYHIPDNLGAQPRDQAVVPNAPVGYFTTLPVASMLQALQASSVPACVSNTAGTYLCNHVFYRAMHALAACKRRIPAGFVHLPRLHEQVAAQQGDRPSLDRATIGDAIRICIAAAANAARRGPNDRGGTP